MVSAWCGGAYFHTAQLFDALLWLATSHKESDREFHACKVFGVEWIGSAPKSYRSTYLASNPYSRIHTKARTFQLSIPPFICKWLDAPFPHYLPLCIYSMLFGVDACVFVHIVCVCVYVCMCMYVCVCVCVYLMMKRLC